jgi:hypothetical protein
MEHKITPMKTPEQIKDDKATKESELKQLIATHQQLAALHQRQMIESQAKINFCEGQIDALEHVLEGEQNAAD